MNGEVCCIMGICCPPEAEARVEALAKEINNELDCGKDEAFKHASFTLKHFDLLPKGSLDKFLKVVHDNKKK